MDFQLGTWAYQPAIVATNTVELPTPAEFKADLQTNYFSDVTAFFSLAVVSTVALWLLLKTVG